MKSYLKSLSRNKLYTAIEAVGLIVSLAFVILIGSYVRQQWQVSKGEQEWKHYYAVGILTDFVNMAPEGLAGAIKEEIPGVDKASVLTSTRGGSPNVGDICFRRMGVKVVEPDFFDMFPIPWVEGSEADLGGDHVAISEKVLAQLGPAEEVLGKRLTTERDTLTISAVFKDMGTPMFQNVDFLCVRDPQPLSPGAFGGTYCLISSSMPEKDLRAAVNSFFKAHDINKWTWNDDLDLNGSMVRMDQMYFSDLNRAGNGIAKGNRSLLVMLSAVVLLLLLSSVFNYINLSAAFAGKRIKEMGTRAILGASRGSIVRTFLAESLLFTAVCATLSIVLAYYLTPVLTRYVETRSGSDAISVPFSWQWDWISVGVLVLLVLVLGLLAGWIPSRIASKYDAVQVVKGDYRLKNKRLFSKVFIVFQTALAVLLLSFALILEHQFSHMVHRPLGANVDNLYFQYLVSQAHADAVEQLPFVTESGYSSGYPGGPGWKVGVTLQELSNKQVTVSYLQCNPKVFEMFQFDIVEDFHLSSGGGVWVTESTLAELEMDPVNPVFPQGLGYVANREIAGILKDFAVTDAAHVDGQETGIVVVDKDLETDYLVLKIDGDHKEAEKTLRELYTRFSMEQDGYEGMPELSGFIQDELTQRLDEAKKYMRLMELFMYLAILVSVLGLLAMSALFASEQTHDIAVRKVFGGTVGGEVLRGVGTYMLLVLIACVIAVPVAIWLSGRYLESYNYRISGYGWIFAVAAVIALAISFLAVLWQTLKAANTNPAIELKKE